MGHTEARAHVYANPHQPIMCGVCTHGQAHTHAHVHPHVRTHDVLGARASGALWQKNATARTWCVQKTLQTKSCTTGVLDKSNSMYSSVYLLHGVKLSTPTSVHISTHVRIHMAGAHAHGAHTAVMGIVATKTRGQIQMRQTSRSWHTVFLINVLATVFAV